MPIQSAAWLAWIAEGAVALFLFAFPVYSALRARRQAQRAADGLPPRNEKMRDYREILAVQSLVSGLLLTLPEVALENV
ncbi:MAG: hypothetical protein AAF725_17285 [Acidobacteriota bacterium]